MKLTVLIENKAVSDLLAAEHGLSVYVETGDRNVLVDFGDSGAFADNARILGVDISKVDLAFLSHGHYDHGNGLPRFFRENSIAPVYISRHAFGKYYIDTPDGPHYIGLPELESYKDRLILTDGSMEIAPGMSIISDIKGYEYYSSTNKVLKEKLDEEYVEDPFIHEQSLFIDGERSILLAGCAHRGIVNILQRCIEVVGKAPDIVLGGFHLSNPRSGASLSDEELDSLADRLLKYPSVFYTGHCTGDYAYERLKAAMGDRLFYGAGGTSFEF